MNDSVQIIPMHAPLANLAFGVEQAVRAERPRIVHALNYRDSQGVQHVINRRRNQRINIVDVSQIGPIRGYQRFQIARRAPGIYGVCDEPGLAGDAEILDFVIPARVKNHFVAPAFEEFAFGQCDGILSAKLLEKSMRQQDLQTSIPASLAR
jgi:hypothetical protein